MQGKDVTQNNHSVFKQKIGKINGSSGQVD